MKNIKNLLFWKKYDAILKNLSKTQEPPVATIELAIGILKPILGSLAPRILQIPDINPTAIVLDSNFDVNMF